MSAKTFTLLLCLIFSLYGAFFVMDDLYAYLEKAYKDDPKVHILSDINP